MLPRLAFSISSWEGVRVVPRPAKRESIPAAPRFNGKNELVEEVGIRVRVGTRRWDGASDRIAVSKGITMGLWDVAVRSRRVLGAQVRDEVVGGAFCGISTSVIKSGNFLRGAKCSRGSSTTRRLLQGGREFPSLQSGITNARSESHRRLKRRECVRDMIRGVHR